MGASLAARKPAMLLRRSGSKERLPRLVLSLIFVTMLLALLSHPLTFHFLL